MPLATLTMSVAAGTRAGDQVDGSRPGAAGDARDRRRGAEIRNVVRERGRGCHRAHVVRLRTGSDWRQQRGGQARADGPGKQANVSGRQAAAVVCAWRCANSNSSTTPGVRRARTQVVRQQALSVHASRGRASRDAAATSIAQQIPCRGNIFGGASCRRARAIAPRVKSARRMPFG